MGIQKQICIDEYTLVVIRYISKNHTVSKTFDNYPGDLVIEIYGYKESISVGHYINGGKPDPFRMWSFQYESLDSKGTKVWHKLPVPNRDILLKTFKHIRTKFRYQHEWVNLRKDAMRLIYTPVAKEWDMVLPDKIAIWANGQLQKLSKENGDGCIDNYRVARVGNTCQEKRYRRQLKNGCCGFHDCIMICPIDGKPYRLGFNYGH